MSLVIHQVDAFTSTAFAGNPAAVCVLAASPSERWMQHVAREMNLSETAFLCREPDGYRLRWFTPAVEVKLCGHATLASAHVLWEMGALHSREQARFHTLSGLLTASRTADGIVLDFPAVPPEACDPPADLAEALGTTPRWVGRNGMDYLVELDSEPVVRSLRPNLERLARLPVRGLIVTSQAETAGFDFVSRFFAPAAGVPEDPVTGSAHCCLGPYWQSRFGRSDFTAYQASERGGVVGVGCRGDRVLLTGQAVTVLRGELLIAPG